MLRAPKPKKIKPSAAVALALRTLDALREQLDLEGDVEPFIEDGAGRLFKYNGRHWQEISDATARAILWRHADDPLRSSDRQRSEALRYIRARCHREAHEWGRVADWEVPCANGVVDVRKMKLRAHRAEDFIEAVIPHSFDRRAEAPVLSEYLSSCFGDVDEQRHAALQAFAGYVVLPHARFKKAAVLHGPGDTGKTQFVLLLKELVGAASTCSLSVDEMDDPVARSVLVAKLLNVLTELPQEAMIRDGGFKTLVSTEDPVQINPKYAQPFMYSSRAKHVIATNTLPRINDRTDATFNRLYIIPFDRVIPREAQDRELQARFRGEMAGVLRWALQGAASLVAARGEFPPIEMATRRLDELREEANPVAMFVREAMIAEDNARCPVAEITAAFNKWNGGKRLDVRQVARMLRGAFGEECLAKAWCHGVKATAQSLIGHRLRTHDEAALAEGRMDWQPRAPADPPA